MLCLHVYLVLATTSPPCDCDDDRLTAFVVLLGVALFTVMFIVAVLVILGAKLIKCPKVWFCVFPCLWREVL